MCSGAVYGWMQQKVDMQFLVKMLGSNNQMKFIDINSPHDTLMDILFINERERSEMRPDLFHKWACWCLLFVFLWFTSWATHVCFKFWLCGGKFCLIRVALLSASVWGGVLAWDGMNKSIMSAINIAWYLSLHTRPAQFLFGSLVRCNFLETLSKIWFTL